MKSRRTQIVSLALIAAVIGGYALVPHEAHAWSFLPNTEQIVDSVLAWLINIIALPLANMFLQLMGFLLNTTLTLTLHMNSMVSTSGGIVDTTWAVIRDISSIVIIFFLLVASIEIILGLRESHLKHLVVMLAVAGVLMNFSLFFTKVLVDASNVVSLAFYDAIVPPGGDQYNGTGDYLSSAINDGGLSNVFMNALEVQKSYQPAVSSNSGAAGADQNVDTSPLAVFSAGLGGIIIMVIAGLSFLAAAVIFAARIGLLIILMAFSSVWFLGMIFPGPVKKEISDFWWNTLLGQLLVMPIYLFFLYVALRVITDPTFKSILNPSVAANAGSTGTMIISAGVVGTVIQYVIAILLINIPLIAALKYAGASGDLVKSATSRVKGWGRAGLQRSWQETGSKIASKVATSERFKDFAASNTFLGRTVGQAALKGTRGVAQSYNAQLDKQVKERTSFAESLGYDQKAMNQAQSVLRSFQSQLASAKARRAPQNIINQLESQIGLSKTNVTNIENARQKSYADAIMAPSMDNLIGKARKNKVGSAKIQIPILEKQLTQRKDALKETRDDIKQLTKAIGNNPAVGGVAAGTATPAQANQLAALQRDEVSKLATVNGLEGQIDNLKLVK